MLIQDRTIEAGFALSTANPLVVCDALDPSLPLIYVNESFEKLTGYSAAEVIRRNCKFLQNGDDQQPGLKELRTAIEEKRSCRVVLRNYRKDGTFFWNDFNLTPINNASGVTTHFVGVQNHLTTQALLELDMVHGSVSQRSTGDGPATLSRLGDILIARQIVKPDVIDAALKQKMGGDTRKLGELLVADFAVPFQAISDALELQVRVAREESARHEGSRLTANAVRLAQTAMEVKPERDLPIVSISQPLTDAGGDTFFRLRLEDGSHLLVLADVAGHSVISSYAVASFLGMVCSFARDWRDLQDFIIRLNATLLTGPFNSIPICVQAIHWNIETGRLHLISAALPHPLVLKRQDHRVRSIVVNGAPLGILEDPPLGSHVMTLQPGDRVLFGSDGLFETAAPDGSLFEEVAPGLWRDLADVPLGQALHRICKQAVEHSFETIDDLLGVAIEQPLHSSQRPGFSLRFASTFEEIDRACDSLIAFVEEQPELAMLIDERRFDLLLVVREALTNAVIHGNKEDPSLSITMRCQIDVTSEELCLTITDEGPGFTFPGAPTDMDLQTSERGRGMTIIRAFTLSTAFLDGELTLHFSIGAIPDECPSSDL